MASKNNKIILEHIDFSKVNPKSSILVLRCEESSIPEISQHLIDAEFCPESAKGTPILFLRPDESLAVVDEKEMNKAGWFRL